MKNDYAKYMISWIDKINHPLPSPFGESYEVLKAYWKNSEPGMDFDGEKMKEELWTWVDTNGGPRLGNSSDKDMLAARMVLCLASKDQESMDALKDMGFFEDLLEQYGYSRSEIDNSFD